MLGAASPGGAGSPFLLCRGSFHSGFTTVFKYKLHPPVNVILPLEDCPNSKLPLCLGTSSFGRAVSFCEALSGNLK